MTAASWSRSMTTCGSSSRPNNPTKIHLPEIRDVKGFIRKTEAIAGARYAGLSDENIHFMALPFYENWQDREKSAYR